MRALVISGGGSKGAFAGGIAQYLMEEEKRCYDLFLGTSTVISKLPFDSFLLLKRKLLIDMKPKTAGIENAATSL